MLTPLIVPVRVHVSVPDLAAPIVVPRLGIVRVPHQRFSEVGAHVPQD